MHSAYSAKQVALVFLCFPSNVFLWHCIPRAMNQVELDILCCPKDVNTNKSVQYCPLPFNLEHFPPQTQKLCLLQTNSLFSTLNHNQPPIRDISSLWWSVFSPEFARLESHTQNMHQITHENSFTSHFFFKNQKAKGRHLSPTVSLVSMRRVSRDSFEREKNNGFQDRAKFHIRFLKSENAFNLRSFWHIHHALLHIIY